uniref:Uncharacterized protein n=1 Tax=Ditylenchus dipsaci TaxID=166011 RepID=A0A915D285_9BILA
MKEAGLNKNCVCDWLAMTREVCQNFGRCEYDRGGETAIASDRKVSQAKKLQEQEPSVARKVLLYLDNFSGNSKISLQRITLKFLPPNTTARSQFVLRFLLG